MREPVETLARWALPVAVAAAAGAAVVHFLNVEVGDGAVHELDFAAEGNFATWLTIVAFFTAGLGAALAALAGAARPVVLLALAAAFAFLSLDDAIQIHERLGDKAAARLFDGDDDWASRLQLVIIGPVLAVVLAGLWWLRGHVGTSASRLLGYGLGGLVGAVLVEQVLGTATKSIEHQGTADVARTALEEGVELGAAILLAAALLVVACEAVARLSRGDRSTPAG